MRPATVLAPLAPVSSQGLATAQAIRRESDVRMLVLQVQRAAARLGFSAVGATQLATAASELAMNILKYAGQGEIRWLDVARGRRHGLELWALDQGPGIADIALAMQEHFSTRGTLGLGLPGTRRLVDEFWIDSALGKGTQVCIRKWR